MFPLLEPPAPCPGCASADVRPLHVFRNLKPVVPVPYLALLGCPECGLVYTSPRPTEDDLFRYYADGEDDGWGKGERYDDPQRAASLEKWLRNKHATARRLLSHAADAIALSNSAERHAFDFGCGGGAFLDVLQDDGWKTTGLEPARLREFTARRHTIVDRIPGEPSFDLVNVHHVLEHLLDPVQVLDALARASRPHAVLLCSVPDLGGLARHHDLRYASNPHHINSFTDVSLWGMLQRTGWRPVRVESGTCLPNPSEDDTRRIIGVAQRDPNAASQARPREPLRAAEDALREYGRLLGADGKPVS